MPNRWNTGCNCCVCKLAEVDEDYVPSDPWQFEMYDTQGGANRNGGQIAFGSNGETIRLVFGFVDDDNYAYVEAYVETTVGADDGWLSLGKRVGGVDTTLLEGSPAGPTPPFLVRATNASGSHPWYIKGSLYQGILVGGVDGTLTTFPSGYSYTLGTDCGFADGKTGSSQYIGASGTYGPTRINYADCPGNYETCCWRAGVHANSVMPATVTVTLTPTPPDSWTGSWVLPLTRESDPGTGLGCVWSISSPFTIQVTLSDDPSIGVSVLVFDSPDIAVGTGGRESCVEWVDLDLTISLGATKSLTMTLDAN